MDIKKKDIIRVVYSISVVMVVIYWLSNLPLHESPLTLIRNISPFWLVMGILVFILEILLRIIRMRYSMSFFTKKRITLRRLTPVFILGFFFGSVTPSRSGEPVRAYFLKKYKGIPLNIGVMSTLLERVIEVTGLFLIMALVLLFYPVAFVSNNIIMLIVVILFVFFCGIVFYLFIGTGNFFISRIINRDIPIVSKIVLSLKKLENNFLLKPKREKTNFLINMFIISIVITIVDSAIYIMVFRGLNIYVAFTTVLFIISWSAIGGWLSQTPGGIGTTEGLLVYYFIMVGVPSNAALTVSIVSRFIAFYSLIFIGGLLALIENKEPKRLNKGKTEKEKKID